MTDVEPNSKFEYRNPKQARRTETPNVEQEPVLATAFCILNFGFVSDFGFRDSCFGLFAAFGE
jgi:hypothetical protein